MAFSIKIIVVLTCIFLCSCNQERQMPAQNFSEKIVDFLIENADEKSDKVVLLLDSKSVLQDADVDEERELTIVEMLKNRGFRIDGWGYGNFPLDAKANSVSLSKDSCACMVSGAWLSCVDKRKQERHDFIKILVDFVVESAAAQAGKIVELPGLYDTLSIGIPDDESETILLVEVLKKDGFEVADYSKGNFPSGAGMVSVTLEKESCQCRVDKMYYNTLSGNEHYQMTESIECRSIGGNSEEMDAIISGR